MWTWQIRVRESRYRCVFFSFNAMSWKVSSLKLSRRTNTYSRSICIKRSIVTKWSVSRDVSADRRRCEIRNSCWTSLFARSDVRRTRRANWYEIQREMTCRVNGIAISREYDWRTIGEFREFEWREEERARERRETEGVFQCIPMRRDVTLAGNIRGVIRWRSKGHARDTRRVMVRVFSFARRNEDSDVAARSSMNLEDRCLDIAVVVGQGWSRKSVSSPQARTPLAAAVVVGAGHGATGIMPRGLPTRRGLQTLALVIATAYATILLYQAVAPRQVIRIRAIVLSASLLLSRARARTYIYTLTILFI